MFVAHMLLILVNSDDAQQRNLAGIVAALSSRRPFDAVTMGIAQPYRRRLPIVSPHYELVSSRNRRQ